MTEITPSLSLEDSEIQFEYIRASGPGGQNVNKVATSVQLRFDITNSQSIDSEVKDRLIKLGGNRVTTNGVLILEAKRFRTQEQNRIDATQRLITLIQKALEKPKLRKATRPGVTAKAARIGDKKRRGETKRIRQYIPQDWE
jgi:ribosome-associated protein